MKQIREIFNYTKGLRRYILAIALLSIISSLLSFVVPNIVKYATDWAVSIVADKSVFTWKPLILFGLLMVGASIISAIVGDVSGYFGDQLAIRTRHQLSTAYYKHLLSLPQSYFDKESMGKVVNRLYRAIIDITNFLQLFSNNLLQMLITTLLTLVVLAFYGWQLALLFIILIPANFYLTARTSGRWQRVEKEKNKHFDRASGRFTEVIGQIRLVKSFIAEKREYKQFDEDMRAMIGLTATQSKHWHGMNFMRTVVFGVIQAITLSFVFYFASAKRFSIGDIALLVMLIQQAGAPLRGLSFFVDSYQRAVANSRDYIEAMEITLEVDQGSCVRLSVSHGDIRFDHVSFAYSDGARVLNDISFTVKKGEKVALVGESGGGKTTITNLLMGLYSATDGSIFIDDQDIRKVRQADVRAHIATVFQESVLFSGTIRDNIAYGRPDATDDEIMKAAKTANADTFINKFENGLDTEVGERGVTLSGGQRQRIAIARAVLKDAPILILDEATSSLDSRAEHEVQEALDRLMKYRTTLIIAHRLSTIAGVDRIVTLKKGRVDEIGTPVELAKTNGIYAQLLKLQLGASEVAKRKLARFEIAE